MKRKLALVHDSLTGPRPPLPPLCDQRTAEWTTPSVCHQAAFRRTHTSGNVRFVFVGFFFYSFCFHFFLFINICSCIRGMTNTQSVSWNQFYKWHSRLQISVGSLTGSRFPTKVNTFFFPLSSVFDRSHFISPVILHVTLIAFDKLIFLSPSFFLLDISDCIDIYIL